MEYGLTGKVAVVTGGSKGIGYATAKQFLLEGARVAICARHQEELTAAAEELGTFGEIYWQAVDATDDKAVYGFAQKVVERFGRLDIWVNNVGASVEKRGSEYTAEEIDWLTGVCFKSTVYGCQAAFRFMSNGGSIVNISSLAARCATVGRSTLYGPLKSAVVGLSTTLAGEYAAYGIRVNAVLPGFTSTPKVKESIPEEELNRNVLKTLLRRAAEPEEIAKPVVFLASDAASYITASSLEVSGGHSVVLNPSYSYDCKEKQSE